MRVHLICALVLLSIASSVDAAPRRWRCKETNATVGYRTCSRFGSSWSTPRWVPSLMIDVGMVMHWLSPGTAGRESVPRSMTGVTDAVGTAFGPSLRLSFAIHAVSYVGVEAFAGAASFDDNEPVLGDHIRGGGVVGVQTSWSRLTVGAELAMGHEMLLARRHGLEGTQPAVLRSGLAVDGRARASLWLTPWITSGVSFGASAIHRGEVSLGVYVALHGRTFDGRK